MARNGSFFDNTSESSSSDSSSYSDSSISSKETQRQQTTLRNYQTPCCNHQALPPNQDDDGNDTYRMSVNENSRESYGTAGGFEDEEQEQQGVGMQQMFDMKKIFNSNV